MSEGTDPERVAAGDADWGRNPFRIGTAKSAEPKVARLRRTTLGYKPKSLRDMITRAPNGQFRINIKCLRERIER